MHARLISGLVAVLMVLSATAPSRIHANDKDAPIAAKDDAKAASKDDKSSAKDDEIKLPPFPADKTIHQSMQLGGRTLKYDVTVGSLPVFDEKGKQIASVMFTAYTVPVPAASRHTREDWRQRPQKARGNCTTSSQPVHHCSSSLWSAAPSQKKALA